MSSSDMNMAVRTDTGKCVQYENDNSVQQLKTGFLTDEEDYMKDFHVGFTQAPYMNYEYQPNEEVYCRFTPQPTGVYIALGKVVGLASNSIPLVGVKWIVQFKEEDAKNIIIRFNTVAVSAQCMHPKSSKPKFLQEYKSNPAEVVIPIISTNESIAHQMTIIQPIGQQDLISIKKVSCNPDTFSQFMYYPYSQGELVHCIVMQHRTNQYVVVTGKILNQCEVYPLTIRWLVEFDPKVANIVFNCSKDLPRAVLYSQNMCPSELIPKKEIYGVNNATSIVSLDDVYPLKMYIGVGNNNPYLNYQYIPTQRIYCAVIGDKKSNYVCLQAKIIKKIIMNVTDIEPDGSEWWVIEPCNINAANMLYGSNKHTQLVINSQYMYPGGLACKECHRQDLFCIMQWNGKCTNCYDELLEAYKITVKA